MLSTLENVKSYLGRTGMVGDDPLLSRLLNVASKWFEIQVERTILSATYTDTTLGSGARSMVTKHYPVQTVTSVLVNGDVIPQAILATDTGWRQLGSVIALKGSRFTEDALVEITYTAGFATVPADVEQAVIEITADLFKYKDRQGVMSSTNGTGSTTSYAPSALSPFVQSVIDAYKRPGV